MKTNTHNFSDSSPRCLRGEEFWKSSPLARNFCYFYAISQKKSIKTRAKLIFSVSLPKVSHDCDFKYLSCKDFFSLFSFHCLLLSSQRRAFLILAFIASNIWNSHNFLWKLLQRRCQISNSVKLSFKLHYCGVMLVFTSVYDCGLVLLLVLNLPQDKWTGKSSCQEIFIE